MEVLAIRLNCSAAGCNAQKSCCHRVRAFQVLERRPPSRSRAFDCQGDARGGSADAAEQAQREQPVASAELFGERGGLDGREVPNAAARSLCRDLFEGWGIALLVVQDLLGAILADFIARSWRLAFVSIKWSRAPHCVGPAAPAAGAGQMGSDPGALGEGAAPAAHAVGWTPGVETWLLIRCRKTAHLKGAAQALMRFLWLCFAKWLALQRLALPPWPCARAARP